MKKTLQTKPPLWVASLTIYLVLVWGFALIRSKYLWITGDDPNLLIQAELTSRGLKPNLDFSSGYPGLSQYLQGLLINAFGLNIFSQHLYSAILATITGGLVCVNFKNIKPWLLSTALIIIYCQQHLVNPTPNPGHLFEVICLVVFTVFRNKKTSTKKTTVSTSIILGVAFLSKQYALFLLVGYVISEIARVDWKKHNAKKIPSILFLGLVPSLGYFLFLIPNSNSKNLVIINLLILITPFFYWTLMMHSINFESIYVDGKSAFRRIIGSSMIFVLTISIGLCIMYRTTDVFTIIRQILIEAPRSINSNLVLIDFGLYSFISLAAFIGFIYCLYLTSKLDAANNLTKTTRISATIVLSLCTIAVFSKLGNLSSNLFLAIYPIFIMYLYLRKKVPIKAEVFSFFFVLSTYMFVLIPYPNVNFHMCILVIGTLIVLEEGFPTFSQPSKNIFFLLPILLTAILLIHEHASINSMQSYQIGKIAFKSSSVSWKDSIRHARAAGMDYHSCPDMGCKLLVLMREDKVSPK